MNFEIYDTGSGMDDLDLRKMINGEVDSLIIKNPGMKLPLVNQMLDKLGCKLKSKSTLGKGTEFQFFFNVQTVQQKEKILKRGVTKKST